MLGRAPTKAEQAHMDTVAQIGCIACIVFHERSDLFGTGYCEVHHVDGSQKPGCHEKTVGLCERHHRIPDNQTPKRWISLHGDGRDAFAKEYCTEQDLLQIQARFIERHRQLVVI